MNSIPRVATLLPGPAEIDFSKGVRGLHHVPATARILMPASIERSVWEYFSGKAEQRGVETVGPPDRSTAARYRDQRSPEVRSPAGSGSERVFCFNRLRDTNHHVARLGSDTVHPGRKHFPVPKICRIAHYISWKSITLLI